MRWIEMISKKLNTIKVLDQEINKDYSMYENLVNDLNFKALVHLISGNAVRLKEFSINAGYLNQNDKWQVISALCDDRFLMTYNGNEELPDITYGGFLEMDVKIYETFAEFVKANKALLVKEHEEWKRANFFNHYSSPAK